MYYHYAIILTFRPFIDLRTNSSGILPRSLCIQAADAIQGHMRSYAQLYSLRRTPSFVPYLVLMSCRLYLAADGLSLEPGSSSSAGQRKQGWPKGFTVRRSASERDETLKKVQRGIDDLGEMQACHRVASIAWKMLKYLVDVWKVYVEIGRVLEGGQRRGGHDQYWASVSAKRGTDFFLSSKEQDDSGVDSGQDLTEDDSGAKPSGDAMMSLLQSSDALRGALFWPALRQPPPLIPRSRNDLEQAGFEPLD